ncbi:MAG: hypothetical protein HYV60_07205 [Planctomycetia bacterium]|nr:hypothetical protein [Planctomycetia bacterium]
MGRLPGTAEQDDPSPPVADRRELILSKDQPLRVRTRAAGVFLFLPLLAELKFDQLVAKAGYPGTQMVPSDAALLSLLALKLLRKERLSHIDDFNADAALGLFAGLNVLPKKSFVTDYSYHTKRQHQQRLLGSWVKKLSPVLLPEATAFSLDFHPIPYRGEEAELENHYLPCRGVAGPSVQTFFAQEHKNQVFCYANANLTRSEQSQEVLRFADYWKDLTGQYPEWLYFDSKLATYAELSELNARDIAFVTIRRRGTAILKHLKARPQSDWTSAVLDIPKRRHKRIRYVEETIQLDDYDGELRQIAATGLGREHPTLFLTNDLNEPARAVMMNYARRNGIEDGLGTNVNFFHLDNLSSEVRLNVDLDVTLTVLANCCYKWLASKLKGFEKAKPKQLSRKFVETSGEIEVLPNRTIRITFDRRSHNPILQEADLAKDQPKIAWLQNHRIEFAYR